MAQLDAGAPGAGAVSVVRSALPVGGSSLEVPVVTVTGAEGPRRRSSRNREGGPGERRAPTGPRAAGRWPAAQGVPGGGGGRGGRRRAQGGGRRGDLALALALAPREGGGGDATGCGSCNYRVGCGILVVFVGEMR